MRQHCTGPLGTREGQKGRELISVSIFHVSITLLHTLVTISLNLITTLPGKWCYPHVYMTDSCLSHKNNSNDLIGVVIIIMFKLWCIFFFFSLNSLFFFLRQKKINEKRQRNIKELFPLIAVLELLPENRLHSFCFQLNPH